MRRNGDFAKREALRIVFAALACDVRIVYATMASTESDLFALGMLCTVLLSFGVLLMLGFCMFRAASRRDKDVDDLIDEVGEEEKVATSAKIESKMERREDWEKDGNWWKGD